MTLLRSNMEFAKRVFLDRLTTDAQPLLQPAHIDEGPGDVYVYAGVYDPFNFGVGADCSGSAGIFIGAALNGPSGMSWGRQFSTETFPGPFPGFRQVSQSDLLNNPYPIKVCIMHGGGGPNSHMNICIDGWVMESNGRHGTCTELGDITPQSSNYWNDFWVYDSPITEDTTWRQKMGYPRGLDYAGGRPSGASLKAAGVSFVCRYVSDGGSGLPDKILTAGEFSDLVANGIAVVFNWETTADMMLGGMGAGVSDATTALNYIRSLPGAPQNPVVYFSCDFDEAPPQDAAVEDYCRGAATVLGGVDKVGLYGSYYICQRAMNAGVCKYMWQTEAWSGGNIEARVNIMQRNGLGYQTVEGVQCDINEAHTDDFGQFVGAAPAPNPTPTPTPGVFNMLTEQQQQDIYNFVMWTFQQLAGVLNGGQPLPGSPTPSGSGWPQLGTNAQGQSLTMVDALAAIKADIQQVQTGMLELAAVVGGHP